MSNGSEFAKKIRVIHFRRPSLMKMYRKRQIVTFMLSASLLVLLLSPAHLAASTLTLAWDPNTEPDLNGYIIYYGTQSASYDFVIDVGNVTRYAVTGLDPETRYYFALTAYDNTANESDFSWEVSAMTGGELAVDFGSAGLYQYDGNSWSRITPADAQHLAVYDGKLVGDFGSAGLWEFDGVTWTKLTPADADNTGNCMVAYGTILVVDLGSLGLWQYDGSSTWSRITPADAQHLAVYGSKLVGDFGSAGLWEFDGSSWTKLTPADADNTGNSMVAYGISLVVDFGSAGLYQYDGNSWSRITASDPQYLAVYGNKLVGDFGSAGLWEFDGTRWYKLTSSDADNTGNCMVPYGTGLAVDFGSNGLFLYDGNVCVWILLTPANPDSLAVYDGKLVGDFGSAGLWEFDGSSWSNLTSSDADNTGNCMVGMRLN
jgi:hypothetical protein